MQALPWLLQSNVVVLDERGPGLALGGDLGGELIQADAGREEDRATFACTKKENQPTVSKPGKPACAMVGTSGMAGSRFSPVTARMRTLPPLANAMAETGLLKRYCTRPATRSVMAGASPL